MATLSDYKNVRFFATARDYSPKPLWFVGNPSFLLRSQSILGPFWAEFGQSYSGMYYRILIFGLL